MPATAAPKALPALHGPNNGRDGGVVKNAFFILRASEASRELIGNKGKFSFSTSSKTKFSAFFTTPDREENPHF